MKINKLFLGLAIIIAMISCSDSDSEIEENVQPSNEFEEILAKYNLFNTNVKYESVQIGSDTNTIYFNGRIKDKLIIKGFSRTNKTSIFSNDEFTLDTIVNINEGYGESSIYNITDFSIRKIHKFENDYAFLLWGWGYTAPGEKLGISCDLYFISDQANKRIKSFTQPKTDYFFSKIIPWFENSFLVLSNSDFNHQHKWNCYTMDGLEQFEVNKFADSGYYTSINIQESIRFENKFIRRNLKNDKIIWESENPLADLPEDTRIDDAKFSQTEDGYINCKINYTKKDGVKGERTYKVEIASGDFTLQ
ncbi:MAG: hypothetical protein JEZ01_11975 [Labilibaculum sp.]|nr:hypothetical protein [Labilibaculum sp.]MBI9058471.1 hypothetical protein [Labilibaculum sp.]